jgi:hypothetical protein
MGAEKDELGNRKCIVVLGFATFVATMGKHFTMNIVNFLNTSIILVAFLHVFDLQIIDKLHIESICGHK